MYMNPVFVMRPCNFIQELHFVVDTVILLLLYMREHGLSYSYVIVICKLHDVYLFLNEVSFTVK